MAKLLAYGSLCSGLGLQELGRVVTERVERVRLGNCRRGFGKLSQYGDRYAMVLEPLRGDAPVHVLANTATASEGVEAMALTVTAADLGRVARREGYDPDALQQLERWAGELGLTISRFLWRMLESVGFSPAEYRRLLFERTGYTSPHYIPHPVAWDDEEPALIFLPPGAEGSGSESIVPVRVATGMADLLSVAAAWRKKSTPSQIEYFAMCLIAEMHGVSFADVLMDLEPASQLAELLKERLNAAGEHEPVRFRAALGLSVERYEDLRSGSSSRAWWLDTGEQRF